MSSEPVNPESAVAGTSSSTAAAAPVLAADAEAAPIVAATSEPAGAVGAEPFGESGPASGAANAGVPDATGDSEPSASDAAPAPEAEGGLPSNEELNQFMDQYAAPQQAPTEGEIVEGRVIAVAALGVVVDIGGKSEGLIPAQEFVEVSDPAKLLPGQTIEVQLTGEHKEGYRCAFLPARAPPPCVGRPRQGLPRKDPCDWESGGPGQRRLGGGHRRSSLPSLLASGSPAAPRTRRLEGPRTRGSRTKAESQAR